MQPQTQRYNNTKFSINEWGCTKTVKIQSGRLARMVATYLWEEMCLLLAFERRLFYNEAPKEFLS